MLKCGKNQKKKKGHHEIRQNPKLKTENRKRKSITKCLERNYSFRIELAEQLGRWDGGTGVAKSGLLGYPQQLNAAPANDAPRYPSFPPPNNTASSAAASTMTLHRLPGAINCG